ncbi:MAG: hypothetical protein OEZ10_01060 [Gammaproteobacteria bacterium]|nr:hypothetical protein [Gammaproteobacteria bacterium]
MLIRNNIPAPSIPTPIYTEYNFLKAASQECMPRDQGQSRRIHEPTFRKPLYDPMTGDAINVASDQPQIVDGNLTLYFTSDNTRKAYMDMPFNHPNPRLPFPASHDDDRGG